MGTTGWREAAAQQPRSFSSRVTKHKKAALSPEELGCHARQGSVAHGSKRWLDSACKVQLAKFQEGDNFFLVFALFIL